MEEKKFVNGIYVKKVTGKFGEFFEFGVNIEKFCEENHINDKGYILEIKIIHYINACGEYYGQIFNLATDYLTTSQLAFTGTCEFFRIITWLLTAIQKEEKSYTGGGCSMPTEEVIKELNKEGLYIPSGYTDSRFNDCSLEQAIDYVIEIYNNYLEAKCK